MTIKILSTNDQEMHFYLPPPIVAYVYGKHIIFITAMQK